MQQQSLIRNNLLDEDENCKFETLQDNLLADNSLDEEMNPSKIRNRLQDKKREFNFAKHNILSKEQRGAELDEIEECFLVAID